jgi:hypothetical protein
MCIILLKDLDKETNREFDSWLLKIGGMWCIVTSIKWTWKKYHNMKKKMQILFNRKKIWLKNYNIKRRNPNKKLIYIFILGFDDQITPEKS